MTNLDTPTRPHVPANPEYWVVSCHVVGDPTLGYDICYSHVRTLSSLTAAKRWGLRTFGHDDFVIIIAKAGRLYRVTWMGEDRGDTDDDMHEIAHKLDLTYEVPA